MSAASYRRAHLAAMGAWGLLLVPTMAWWRQSIVWVVFMSWYANFAGHWAAYQASRAEENN